MRRPLRLISLLLLALAPAAAAQEAAPSLKGKFLVADPAMPDPRFAGTVVFLIAHSREGAVGLVVNRPGARRPLAEVMRAAGLAPPAGPGAGAEVEPFWGGPVAADRVLLLHSDDFKAPSTASIAPGIALSAPKEALEAAAAGTGPRRMLLAVGYAGWAPGQLERELELGSWAVVAAGAELLFGPDHAGKWEQAWKLRAQEL